MFRASAFLLAAGLLVGFAPIAKAADDNPKDIIARAIKAHGGEELLGKNKASISRNKGKITIPGAGEVEFTQETMTMLPDKLKDSMELSIGGKTVPIILHVNGKTVSLEADGKPVPVDDKVRAAFKDAGHLLRVGRLVALTGKEYELSLIGEEKVNDQPAIGVRVVTKGEKDVNLYFDKKTHLLAKLQVRSNEPFTGMEITEDRIISEYTKNKEGISVPKKLIVKHDSKTFLDVEVVEIQYLEKLDESEFKK